MMKETVGRVKMMKRKSRENDATACCFYSREQGSGVGLDTSLTLRPGVLLELIH